MSAGQALVLAGLAIAVVSLTSGMRRARGSGALLSLAFLALGLAVIFVGNAIR